jgi:hypothetical protein
MARRRRQKTPMYFYHQQKSSAAKRDREARAKGLPGIEWLFTFERWWAVWEASGKWEQRGCRRGEYVMARHGDTGPYAPDNVSIVEAGVNGAAALRGWGEKKKARESSAPPPAENTCITSIT